MRSRRICVVTGTRAEFGLLKWLMLAVDEDPRLDLACLVTGSHLDDRHGGTVREIEEAGFVIHGRVPMLSDGDSAAAIAAAFGSAVPGIHSALVDLAPEAVVVLGDRFEALAAVTAATIARIPIAHIHGGESSEGLIDEGMRHAITKLSHLHFTAHPVYRRRVVQLGEDPARVWEVGALGVEAALRTSSLDDSELAGLLGRALEEPCLLVTLHPLTLNSAADGPTAAALLEVLADERDSMIVLTLPNADHNNHEIRDLVLAFAEHHHNAVAIPSLGQRGYLSVMRRSEAVIGNSSSGIIEAPAVGVPSIDIGDRQRGRIRAASVIHCEPDPGQIRAALRTARDPGFRSSVERSRTADAQDWTSSRIAAVLRDHPLDGILMKRFHEVRA